MLPAERLVEGGWEVLSWLPEYADENDLRIASENDPLHLYRFGGVLYLAGERLIAAPFPPETCFRAVDELVQAVYPSGYHMTIARATHTDKRRQQSVAQLLALGINRAYSE